MNIRGQAFERRAPPSQAIFGAVFEDAGKGGAGMDQAVALYKRHWPSAESWAAQVRLLVCRGLPTSCAS